MPPNPGDPMPEWDWVKMLNHFNRHKDEFRPPLTSHHDYEASSKATIQMGQRFTYDEPTSGLPRIGYHDRNVGLFTAVRIDHRRIVSHFPARESYVRQLPLVCRQGCNSGSA